MVSVSPAECAISVNREKGCRFAEAGKSAEAVRLRIGNAHAMEPVRNRLRRDHLGDPWRFMEDTVSINVFRSSHRAVRSKPLPGSWLDRATELDRRQSLPAPIAIREIELPPDSSRHLHSRDRPRPPAGNVARPTLCCHPMNRGNRADSEPKQNADSIESPPATSFVLPRCHRCYLEPLPACRRAEAHPDLSSPRFDKERWLVPGDRKLKPDRPKPPAQRPVSGSIAL